MRTSIAASAFLISNVFGAAAGECDCQLEVGNASARTSDVCGKVWEDNHCLLKEVTVSDSSPSQWKPALMEMKIEIPLTEDSEPITDFLSVPPDRLRGIINVLILDLLADIAPLQFTSGVLETLNAGEGAQQMSTLVEGGVVRFNEAEKVPLAISRGCIYGRGDQLNFYLNVNAENQLCPVADLAKVLE